jgi:8-oxo-dGTP diphosphatase
MQQFGEKIDGWNYVDRPGVYAILSDQHQRIGLVEDEGEDHTTALQREVLEETGYRCEVGNFIGAAKQYVITLDGKRALNKHCYYYFARAVAQTGVPESNHKLSWYAPDEGLTHLRLQKRSDSSVWAYEQALTLMP